MLKRKARDVAMVCFMLLPGLAFAGEPYAIAKELAIRSSQDVAVEKQESGKTQRSGMSETNMVESGKQWIEDQANSSLTDEAPENKGRE